MARASDDDRLMRGMADLTAAFSGENEQIVALLIGVVENQRQLAETLDEVAAEVRALRAGMRSGDPFPELDRGANDALRREAQQAARHAEEIVERARGLASAADDHRDDDGMAGR
jgi:hypothetical protein